MRTFVIAVSVEDELDPEEAEKLILGRIRDGFAGGSGGGEAARDVSMLMDFDLHWGLVRSPLDCDDSHVVALDRRVLDIDVKRSVNALG